MRRFITAAATAVIAGAVLGAVAAGPAAARTDDQAFCDAVLDVQAAVGADEPAVADVTAALTALTATAPPEVATSVTALINVLAAGGDPTDDPAYGESLSSIGEYVFDNCGWQTAKVSMAEYEFNGLPKTFTTGPVAIELTNDGAEIHELTTVRITSKDKLKALVKLPEKKAQKKLQLVDHTVVEPGDTAYSFLDLTTPGRYGAVCFVPVGTLPGGDDGSGASEHGGGGKPHALAGMYQEFKVTRAAS
jgi:hypothetical protein